MQIARPKHISPKAEYLTVQVPEKVALHTGAGAWPFLLRPASRLSLAKPAQPGDLGDPHGSRIKDRFGILSFAAHCGAKNGLRNAWEVLKKLPFAIMCTIIHVIIYVHTYLIYLA